MNALGKRNPVARPEDNFLSKANPADEQVHNINPQRPEALRQSDGLIYVPTTFLPVRSRNANKKREPDISLRIAETISRASLVRFSNEPPYSSLRSLLSGERNSCIKYPCAARNFAHGVLRRVPGRAAR